MKKQSYPFFIFLFLTSLSLATLSGACSTSKAQVRTSGEINEGQIQKGEIFHSLTSPYGNSSVEIEYTLGHDHYLFSSRSMNHLNSAKSSMDRILLAEGRVDQAHYDRFLTRAIQFINSPPTLPPNGNTCRNPFKVKVTIGSESHTTQGCRSSDGGHLSKLIKEGEFLLFSSKQEVQGGQTD